MPRLDDSPFSFSYSFPVISPAFDPRIYGYVLLDRLANDSRKAVIICKRTRWQVEAHKHGKDGTPLSDEELEGVLLGKGIEPHAIKLKNDQQKRMEVMITNQLRGAGMSVTLVDLGSLPARLPPLELIVTAGGDGTFLAAASLVVDETPVVGINSDPAGSEGALCVGGKNTPDNLMHMITSRKIKWAHRSRIKVTIHGGEAEQADPLLALNEVFIGERDATKVSYYDISIDGSPLQKQKSSGFIVCSASGSTAWYSAINRVLPDTIADVMGALRTEGATIPENEPTADSVAKKLNESLIEPAESEDLLFCVREPIFNATFLPCPCKGKATRISLKSRGASAQIVLDGHRKIDFAFGTVVTFEIDPKYALKTLL